ncbi:hypothetical protein O7626_04540 [Micromonospora sp. WMMD1102]|uniref:hypothetical protein n=1 Tax=Micromonospora sp. WMMD1102 TaxID=3016105 RepID=UPI0024152636|nr:hypothetical protein [Micromonospora sp. WMMD1102]MDG4785209.1 hypothetical protein [Micromonospora sp. WMMD1102]
MKPEVPLAVRAARHIAVVGAATQTVAAILALTYIRSSAIGVPQPGYPSEDAHSGESLFELLAMLAAGSVAVLAIVTAGLLALARRGAQVLCIVVTIVYAVVLPCGCCGAFGGTDDAVEFGTHGGEPGLVLTYPGWYEPAQQTLSVVLLLACAVVVTLLWTPASFRFFREVPAPIHLGPVRAASGHSPTHRAGRPE